MSQQSGIHAWAAYLPRLSMRRATIAAQIGWVDPAMVARARGRRTLANWDEDAITLAVAAARNLRVPIDLCTSLTFATTTAPFLDRSNAVLIGEALSLDSAVACREAGGSQRAATTALLDALQPGVTGTTLLVAADRRAAQPGSAAELDYGDAAAAVIAGPGPGVARFLGGHCLNKDFVHQYRTQEHDTDYVYEDRWVRDAGLLDIIPPAVTAVLASCGRAAPDIRHFVVPVPQRHGRRLCQALGVDEAALCDDLSAGIGATGVAHALLQLAHALESARPGDLLCVAGFGQGCDAALFEVTAAISKVQPAVRLETAMQQGTDVEEYLKLPVFGRRLKLDRGIRAEADRRTSVATYARRRREINSMLGSRCIGCATPHFPRARVCVSCGAVDAMDDYSFADVPAQLKTFTEDWQAATPAPPLCYGNVAFAGGGNAFLELTDVQPGTLRIGMPLAMQFRIKDFDDLRGFRRYFWKPAPVLTTGMDSATGEDNG